jgi:hypothetical protein
MRREGLGLEARAAGQNGMYIRTGFVFDHDGARTAAITSDSFAVSCVLALARAPRPAPRAPP